MLSQRDIRVYFENPVGRLLEHPREFVIVQYNPGRRNFSELQAFLTHARQLLISRKWHKLVSDQRSMTAFTSEESEWITSTWFSQVTRHELTLHVAALLPQDVFARLASNLIMSQARNSSYTYRYFDNEHDAMGWLEETA